MKKNVIKTVGIAFLASLTLLVSSCSQDLSNPKTDTVLTLGTPEVKGIAYPGVNYIYWNKVSNAKNGYDIAIYYDDIIQDCNIIHLNQDVTHYVDTNLQQGLSKTYKVIATGDSAARALYFTESGASSITLKSIVPPTNTTALELTDYEKGYPLPPLAEGAEPETPDPATILSPNTIKLVKNDDGWFSVSFPAKPYLSYIVYADYGNNYSLTGHHSVRIGTFQNVSLPNNTEVTLNGIVNTSGTYTISIEAYALNSRYIYGNIINATETLKYDSIDLSTEDVATNIKGTISDNVAYIMWTPGKLADGSYIPASYFKVFTAVAGVESYSLIEAPVTALSSPNSAVPTYKIAFANYDKSKAYNINFIVTDGKAFAPKYEISSDFSITESYSTNSLNLTASYTDASTVRVEWTPAINADGSTSSTSDYSVYRKIKGTQDYEYTKLTSEVIAETVLGTTKYYIVDSISDNKKSYDYLISFTNGLNVITNTVTVAPYSITYTSYTAQGVKKFYIGDTKARLIWKPSVINDDMIEPSAYEIYRKNYYSSDVDYQKLTNTINVSKNQNNETVYYIDDSITDNTEQYSYQIRYTWKNTVYYSTQVLSAYEKAIVYAVPAVTLFANENDGIKNDVKVTLEVSAEQTINSVNYIKLDSTTITDLIAADYKEPLNIATATVTTGDNSSVYEWIIGNLPEGTYISVAATVDGNTKYASTSTATASEPDSFVSTTNSNVALSKIATGDDDIKNDVEILITLANEDKVLSSLKYAVANTEEEAKEAALSGTSLAINGEYVVYHYILENVFTASGQTLAVVATISEEGKKDSTIVKTLNYSENGEFEYSPITVFDYDRDGYSNDIAFALGLDESYFNTNTITIIYALGNSKEDALKLLDSSEARVLVTDLSGYYFYEFTPDKYTALKDLPLGKYFAIRITGTGAMISDTVVDLASTVRTSDDYAALRTAAPIIRPSWKDLDGDGMADDLYVEFEVYQNQTFHAYYATGNASEFDFDLELEHLIYNRLFSEKAVEMKTPKLTEKYRTSDKIIYEYKENNLPANTHVGILVVVEEDGKYINDNDTGLEPYSVNLVSPETTAAPSLNQEYLYFDCFNSDNNFNDIGNVTFYTSIGVDQSISSIRYVFAPSITKAKDEFLRKGSTLVKNIEIPETYELYGNVNNNVTSLYKEYQFSTPYSDFINIPDGYYAVIELTISEPGCLDYVKYITTKEWDYYTNYPETLDFEVPAYAHQEEVRLPTLVADDSQNYEYIKPVIYDYLINDDPSNYTYTLTYAYEDTYNNNDPVWYPLNNEAINLTWDYNYDYYTWTKYFKDMPVGDYFVRLTKTRKATASATGKEESVFIDSSVSVVYNVVAPNFSITTVDDSFIINSREFMDFNYDDIEKYDYTLCYKIDYYDDYGTVTYYPEPQDPYQYSYLNDFTWEKEFDANGFETGYYNLTNAVISGINTTDYSYATIYVYLDKVRTIDTYYSDYAEQNGRIVWGIAATVSSGSTLAMNAPYEFDFDGEPYIDFSVNTTAGVEYDSYEWYLDGSPLPAYDSYCEIKKADFTAGSHEIIVKAIKNGVTYIATVTYTK